MSEDFTSLDTTLEAVWTRLENGPREKTAPANVVCLATNGSIGANARMVVLRKTDRENSALQFFTHAASGKIKDVEKNPNAELLVWDRGSQLQVRLKAHLEVTEIDDATWAALGDGAKLNYATDPLPGSTISAPSVAWAARSDHTQMKQITAHIQSIETLHISPEGLYRAVFDNTGSRWIAP